MKLITMLSVLMVMSIAVTSCGSKDKKKSQPAPQAAQVKTMTPAEVGTVTAAWPPLHKQIIQDLTGKYGQPSEATSDMLIWNNNGPWSRTVVKKNDMRNPLEQTASMSVPPEKMGEVAMFNKSVMIDSTSNQVTSSAVKEDLNFLALNLTKEIVQGGMSPMEARRQYSQLTDATKKSNYMHNLNPSTEGSTLEAQESEEAPQ
ncbi:MAG TPA: hypothetical protein VNJ08_16740 [Bacteriovoracaceae bacterium]|nr:hypothetical protein [Bacteriovoracaceae bacterium]